MTSRTPSRPRARRERRNVVGEGSVLAVTDREAEDLTVTLRGDPGGDDDGLGHDRGALVRLDVGGVEEDIGEAHMVEASFAEGAHDRIELLADAADLALLHARIDAQGDDEVIDLARRDTVDIGLHDHRPQCPVDATAGFEQRGEEGALAQLGDVQLDVAGLGREQPAAAAVAVGGAILRSLVSAGADHLAGLELDELLEDECHGIAQDIGAIAGAHSVEQFVECRLGQGHRYLLVLFGRNTLRITSVVPSMCAVCAGQDLGSNPTTRGDTPRRKF
jgi:hypothetical protein